MILLRASLVWLVLIGVETAHGVLRTLLLVPLVGDLPARQTGVLTGSVLIFGVACVFDRWVGAGTTPRLVAVGLLWVVLTILFEIGLGRLVLGLSWERLAEDYDSTRGVFMGLGLLFMAAAPRLAAWLRRSPGPDQGADASAGRGPTKSQRLPYRSRNTATAPYSSTLGSSANRTPRPRISW